MTLDITRLANQAIEFSNKLEPENIGDDSFENWGFILFFDSKSGDLIQDTNQKTIWVKLLNARFEEYFEGMKEECYNELINKPGKRYLGDFRYQQYGDTVLSLFPSKDNFAEYLKIIEKLLTEYTESIFKHRIVRPTIQIIKNCDSGHFVTSNEKMVDKWKKSSGKYYPGSGEDKIHYNQILNHYTDILKIFSQRPANKFELDVKSFLQNCDRYIEPFGLKIEYIPKNQKGN